MIVPAWGEKVPSTWGWRFDFSKLSNDQLNALKNEAFFNNYWDLYGAAREELERRKKEEEERKKKKNNEKEDKGEEWIPGRIIT